ncbi:hypothetical protein SMMN14_05726 [Sphaerulina musiva]
MAPITWTDAARTQLLLIMIHSGTPPRWEKVAQLLNNGCTGEAARQQFKLLRAKAQKEFGDLSTDDDGGSQPKATPAKGRGKKTGAEPAAKSSRKHKVSEEAEEDEEAHSPLKKLKVKKTKLSEVEDDDDLSLIADSSATSLK